MTTFEFVFHVVLRACAFVALIGLVLMAWRAILIVWGVLKHWRNYIPEAGGSKWDFWKARKEPKFWTGGWETPADGRRIHKKDHRRWTYSLRPDGHNDVLAFGERLGKTLHDFPSLGGLRVSEDLWDRWEEMREPSDTPVENDHPVHDWGLTGPIKVDLSFEGLEARWDYWMSLKGAWPR